jgi:hypothetical protein
LPGSALASGNTQTYNLTGHFESLALSCPGIEDCVIDSLTGGLVGTNRLITADFTENANYIFYHDYTLVNSQYGQFDGNEYGVINKNTGNFSSVATSTSTDGCGSTLSTYNSGVIDLDTLADSGTYHSVLVKKSC